MPTFKRAYNMYVCHQSMNSSRPLDYFREIQNSSNRFQNSHEAIIFQGEIISWARETTFSGLQSPLLTESTQFTGRVCCLDTDTGDSNKEANLLENNLFCTLFTLFHQRDI